MAHHPWLVIHDDERKLIQWCPYCGAVRKEAKEKHEGVHTTVRFPHAYETVGRTTCALMQDQEAQAHAHT